MGTYTAGRIIDLAAIQLSDQVNLQWSRTEVLGWIDAGQREIGIISPTCLREVAVMPLVAGSRQQIPPDGFQLLDIYRNYNSAGLGKAIRVTSRRLLEAYDPNWHKATAVTEPTNFMFDPQNNSAFWVYPPSDGTGSIEIMYAGTPAPITDETRTIAVDDVFVSALVDYIMFRANSKQAEFANPQAAPVYYAAFAQAVAAKNAAEEANNPNLALALAGPGAKASEA